MYRLRDCKLEELEELITRYHTFFPFKKIKLEDSTNKEEAEIANAIARFYAGRMGTMRVKFDHNSECYKVPFTAVLDLVQRRNVVLRKGYAYLPLVDTEMIISLVCNKFRAMLSQSLVRTVSDLWKVENDDRVSRIVKSIRTSYFGDDFSNASSQITDRVTPRNLDQFSKESFPPCMRHLHESLRNDHHLKHFGRLQYGLFLKSVGVTLEDALRIWRDEFTKKMEPDKFDKQYAYNIRHSYGKEGKRTNYTPYSCMKIIMSNTPAAGDHHGCPFKHWDEAHLKQMLTSHGMPMKARDKIVDYTQNSHYQLACQCYFDQVHGLHESTFSLEHPSQYFIESRKIRTGGSAIKGEPICQEQSGGEQGVEEVNLTEEEFAQFNADLMDCS